MKKLLFTIAGILLTVNGFGQGYVQFQNAGTSKFFVLNYVTGATNAATSGTIGSQDGVSGSTGTIDVGLYWSTSPFTDASQGTLAGVENIGTTPGILTGNSSFAIAGTNPGDTVYIQIFMWDGTFSTPDDALAAGLDFGASSVGTAGFNTPYGLVGPALQVTLGLPGIYATPIFGTAGTEFGKTYMLNGAPEPVSVVTGVLGAAALMLFRRRSRI